MSRTSRALVAAVLVLLGVVTALLGGQVVACLGPLGVTAVQCARASGIVPDVGVGPPFLTLMISLATFIIAPVAAGRRLQVLVASILGGAIGAAAFLALRPLTMEGFDSSGIWISIARPLDAYALATSIILAALLGTIVMRLLPEVRRIRSARS